VFYSDIGKLSLMSHEDLYRILFSLPGQHGKILDFNQRLEIAIDVAHALTYLHLYAGNILRAYCCGQIF